MAVWLNDTFTDADAVDITSHAGELGTWSLHATTTPRSAVIASNRVRSNVGNQYDGSMILSSESTPGDTYRLTFELYTVSLGPADMAAAIFFNGNAVDSDRYGVQYYIAEGVWRLLYISGGSATVLQDYAQSLTSDTTYTVEVSVSPTLKTVKINGVERLSTTTNAVTGSRVGLEFYGISTDSTGLHINSLVGDTEEAEEQFARPNGDVNTNWTPSTGTDRFATVDEETPDNADYVESATPPSSAQEFHLTNISDPATSTGHTVRYRYAKSVAGGAQINLTVGLYQGATLIAEQTHTNISETPTDGSFTLTGVQADAITDYSDLRIRLTATQV